MIKKIVKVILLLIIGVIIINFAVIIIEEDTIPQKEICSIYFANQEQLQKLKDYFKNLYKQGLYCACYKEYYSELWLSYEEKSSITEKPEELIDILICLNDSYIDRSDINFDDLKAYYDDKGNMLLYIPVIRKDLGSDRSRLYSMVYMDEEYNDISNSGNLIITKHLTLSKDNCFALNKWYYYNKDTFKG